MWPLSFSLVVSVLPVNYTPFTRYNRLSKRLYTRFDNQLYHVNKHPTGCQAGFETGLTTALNEQPLFVQMVVKPGLTTVLNEQLFVQPVVKRLWQPIECLYTQYNRLPNRFDNRFYRVNRALDWIIIPRHTSLYCNVSMCSCSLFIL